MPRPWIRPLLAVGVTVLVGCGSGAGSQVTVTGVVEVGPSCPVEQQGSPCPPQPGQGQVTFVRDGRPVASADVVDGAFSVRLHPDAYVLQPVIENAMSCPSREVTVDGDMTLTVSCDTGIR